MSTATIEDRTTPATQEPVVRLQVPSTAYVMHSWQIDAWERQGRAHPESMQFTVMRGNCGAWDGYIEGADSLATVYILGWLNGRNSTSELSRHPDPRPLGYDPMAHE